MCNTTLLYFAKFVHTDGLRFHLQPALKQWREYDIQRERVNMYAMQRLAKCIYAKRESVGVKQWREYDIQTERVNMYAMQRLTKCIYAKRESVGVSVMRELVCTFKNRLHQVLV